MGFSATDIDFMINRFSVEELRKEMSNARHRLHREFDWKAQMYYQEYINACKLALDVAESIQPATPTTPGQPIKESIESIKSRYDLADYIGQYVDLRKSGSRFYGLCPFHPDKKTPSFVVYSDNNTFHCFGCQVHGSIIDFVMKYHNLDIKGALEKLSR